MGEKLHIVYATDERYLLPTYVAMASAVHNASRKDDLVFDIFDCGISDSVWCDFVVRGKRVLEGGFAVVRHRIDMLQFAGYKVWHASRGIYARLLISDILPEETEWCVYADGDTLFTEDPFLLEDMFDSRYALMGHLDSNGAETNAWYEKNGFSWNRKTYLCAGFILLNLAWARKNNLSKKLLEFIDSHRDVPMNDQDALNIICNDAKCALPSGWGVFSCDAYWRESPCCIHYVGERAWEMPLLAPIFLPRTMRLWFWYARTVARLGATEIAPFFRTRYFLRFCVSRIMKLCFSILDKVPALRGRYALALNRF